MDTNERMIASEGRSEVTYSGLYHKLYDLNNQLTVTDRLLLAAMIKRIGTSKEIKIPVIAFAADKYINMEKKQPEEAFI